MRTKSPTRTEGTVLPPFAGLLPLFASFPSAEELGYSRPPLGLRTRTPGRFQCGFGMQSAGLQKPGFSPIFDQRAVRGREKAHFARFHEGSDDCRRAIFNCRRASDDCFRATFNCRRASDDCFRAAFNRRRAFDDCFRAAFNCRRASDDCFLTTFNRRQAADDALPHRAPYFTFTFFRRKVGTSRSWPSTIVGSDFSKRPRFAGSSVICSAFSSFFAAAVFSTAGLR